jgi:hypothetical protein
MEMEFALPVDPFEVKDRWTDLVKTLTQTKESITKTTKFALENSYVAAELFNVVLKRMTKVRIISY